MGISQYTFIKKRTESRVGQNTGAASAGGETAFMAGRPWKCSGGSDPGRKGRRPGTDRRAGDE